MSKNNGVPADLPASISLSFSFPFEVRDGDTLTVSAFGQKCEYRAVEDGEGITLVAIDEGENEADGQ